MTPLDSFDGPFTLPRPFGECPTCGGVVFDNQDGDGKRPRLAGLSGEEFENLMKRVGGAAVLPQEAGAPGERRVGDAAQDGTPMRGAGEASVPLPVPHAPSEAAPREPSDEKVAAAIVAGRAIYDDLWADGAEHDNAFDAGVRSVLNLLGVAAFGEVSLDASGGESGLSGGFITDDLRRVSPESTGAQPPSAEESESKS